MQGLCEEGAHNAAWEATDFESRYLSYLAEDETAQRSLAALETRVTDGETIVLVCFEGERKRCHRPLLQDRLRARLD